MLAYQSYVFLFLFYFYTVYAAVSLGQVTLAKEVLNLNGTLLVK